MTKKTQPKFDWPAPVTFTSRGQSFTFDFADVDPDKVEQFVLAAAAAGIAKAGVDAAASAASYARDNEIDVAEATEILISKRMAVWKRGDWTSAQRASRDPVLARMVSLARPAVKASDPAAYADATEAERKKLAAAYVEALSARQQTDLRKHAEALIERESKAESEVAALLKL